MQQTVNMCVGTNMNKMGQWYFTPYKLGSNSDVQLKLSNTIYLH
jgi:hypothetical protein